MLDCDKQFNERSDGASIASPSDIIAFVFCRLRYRLTLRISARLLLRGFTSAMNSSGGGNRSCC